MTDPTTILDYMAGKGRVCVRVAQMRAELAGSPPEAARFDGVLAAMKARGEICLWVRFKGKAVAALSSLTAERMDLKLNPASTRWVPRWEDEPPDKNRPRKAGDGRVMCLSDLEQQSPQVIDELTDERTLVNDDPDFGLERIIAEERMLGLVRPTLPLVGVRPWTAENWERAPDAHKCDPKDDPRGDGTGKAPKQGDAPCVLCRGRAMRPMIGLAPMRVGRNRMTRPPALIEGGEYCCRCGAHWLDAIWPKVRRLGDDKTKKNARDGQS